MYHGYKLPCDRSRLSNTQKCKSTYIHTYLVRLLSTVYPVAPVEDLSRLHSYDSSCIHAALSQTNRFSRCESSVMARAFSMRKVASALVKKLLSRNSRG